MKPFDYVAPQSIAEAVALLSDGSRVARAFAGGTDLLVQLRQGRRDVDLVVDIKRIPELTRLGYGLEDGLVLGAAVTCARLCAYPAAREHYPGLVDAVSLIGGAAIQERATVGGNLCNAAPSADSIPALIVLDAWAEVQGPDLSRRVPVREFCIGPGETVLQQGELLVAVHVPPPPARSGAAYLRFTTRKEMDIAVAGAGAWVRLSEDLSRIEAARIALSAVAPTPLAADAAAVALVGQAATDPVFVEAARLAQEAARPISDTRGTAAQRRHLVGVLVRRALQRAVARARQNVPGEA